MSELDEPHARSNRSYNFIDGNEAETLQCGCARGENETDNQTGVRENAIARLRRMLRCCPVPPKWPKGVEANGRRLFVLRAQRPQ